MTSATGAVAGPWPWALVPRELSDAPRPQLDAVVDEVIAAVRAEVPE